MYSVTGETAIVTASNVAPSGKELICIFIQTNKWAGNMLKFHVDVDMKWLGLVLKKRIVSMIQSQHCALFIHGAL